MQENEKDKFLYRYTALTEAERKEIEGIRASYVADTAPMSKIDELRALHAKGKQKALAAALTLGMVGILIFGTGLAMVLEWNIVVWGVACAAVGCVPTAIAYPVYNAVMRKHKKKYGARILALSEEVLGSTDSSSEK